MFRFIEGFPNDVLAVEAVGEITNEDYSVELIPRAEAMMGHGPIKMLYVVGEEFVGFDLEAVWDDSVFGFRHWHDFSQIALVTDHPHMRAMVKIFQPFFHGDVRVFTLSELPAAKDWITNSKRALL